MRGVLALQMPTSGSPITIAIDSSQSLLDMFKRTILARYEWDLVSAETPIERAIRQSELENMRHLLDLVIPELPGEDTDD